MSKTEIVFILDRSGSMYGIKKDAIGGFNSFIEEQKKVEGEANVTLILFNSEVKTVYNSVNIEEVEELNENTYVPLGMTSLLDAVGLGIDQLMKRLSESKEQPDHVVFAILTDGYENSSKEYTDEAVKAKIENLQKEKDWQFIFLGANIDAVSTAKGLGIKGELAGQFTADSKGMATVMMNTNEMVMSYRATGQMMSYVEADKKTQEENVDVTNIVNNININTSSSIADIAEALKSVKKKSEGEGSR